MLEKLKKLIKLNGFWIAVVILVSVITILFSPNDAKISNTILFVTFSAIVWYSYETRKLVKLSEKNLIIAIKPILVVEDVSGVIKIKNIGKSTALNINILEICNRTCVDVMYPNSHHPTGNYNVTFENLAVLPPDSDHTFSANFKLIGSAGSLNPNSSPFFDYENPNFVGSYKVTIKYNDIEMGAWETQTTINKDGIHFEGIREQAIV